MRPRKASYLKKTSSTSKKKRMAYKIRRRAYLPQETAAPVAASPSGEATQDNEIQQLRDRLKQIEAAYAMKQIEARQLTGRAKDSESKLEQLTAELEKHKEFVQRTKQDMEMLRKRAAREKEETQKHAGEEVLKQLIPVLDNFTYALSSLPETPTVETVIDGMEILHREILRALGEAGLQVLSVPGNHFDPKIHDAASTHSDETQDEGVVLKILRPGYMLKEKVLRPAMVVVNKRA